ncbi:hypothetical protein ACNQTB_12360, partial [Corynebacterium diphtheriae]
MTVFLLSALAQCPIAVDQAGPRGKYVDLKDKVAGFNDGIPAVRTSSVSDCRRSSRSKRQV